MKQQVSKKAPRAALTAAAPDADGRETAIELARRAGMSLADWLNAMASEQMASARLRGVSPTGMLPAEVASSAAPAARASAATTLIDPNLTLDGLAEQLTRMSREASATSAAAHPSTTRAMHHLAMTEEWFRASEARTAGLIDMLARRSQVAQETTASLLETVTRATLDTETRTASALEAVKSWMAAADRATRQEAPAGASEPARPADPATSSQLVASIRQLDERLSSLTGEIRTSRAEPGLALANAAADTVAPSPVRPPRRRPLFAAGGTPDLRDAIEEIQARQAQLAGGPVSDTGLFEALRDDIAALARRLDAPAVSPADLDGLRQEVAGIAEAMRTLAPARTIEALELQVRDLADRLDAARQTEASEGAVTALEARYAEILAAVDNIRPASTAAFEDELKTLAREIERVATDGNAEVLAELQAQARQMREAVDRAAAQPEMVSLLGTQITDLAYRLDAMGTRQGADTVLARIVEEAAEIRGQAGALAERLDRVSAAVERSTALAADPGNERLEGLVHDLATRLDGLSNRDADEGALTALEVQVTRMAERLDGLDLRTGDLTGIERSLADLFGHLDETRREVTSAAEAAAGRAVEQAILRFKPDNGTGFEAVRSTLDDLRHAQDRAGRHTQETLVSVQSALDGVAQRIAQLEAEASHRAVTAAPTSDTTARRPQHPTRIQPARIEPQGLIDGARLTDDVPLEPGSGARPVCAAVLAPKPAEALGLLGSAALSARDMAAASAGESRASFIAAARRAAQAAAQEAAQDLSATRQAPADPGAPDLAALLPQGMAQVEAEQASATSSLTRLRQAYQRRRRPILLGLAAVVLALGALQVSRQVSTEQAGFDLSVNNLDLPHLALSSLGLGGDAPVVTAAAEPVSTLERAAPAPSLASAALAPAALPPAKVVATAQVSVVDAGPKVADPAAETPPKVAHPATGASATSAAPSGAGVASAPASTSPALGPVHGIPSLGEAMLTPPVPAATASLPPSSAARALEGAVRAGNPRALFDKGALMADGIDDAAALKTASTYYERAAAKGFAPAAYRLGSMYEKGLGLTRDAAKAKVWYEKAADKGNVKAMHNLAVLYAEGALTGRPDYAMAASWFRKASLRGLRDSEFNLAILSARGLGVAADLKDAYKWFALAARQGDPDAGKKRDEIGARLGPGAIAAASADVARFKPVESPAESNEATLPPAAWSAAKG